MEHCFPKHFRARKVELSVLLTLYRYR